MKIRPEQIKPEPEAFAVGAEVLNRLGVYDPNGELWTEQAVAKLYEQNLPMMALRRQTDPRYAALREKLQELIAKYSDV